MSTFLDATRESNWTDTVPVSQLLEIPVLHSSDCQKKTNNFIWKTNVTDDLIWSTPGSRLALAAAQRKCQSSTPYRPRRRFPLAAPAPFIPPFSPHHPFFCSIVITTTTSRPTTQFLTDSSLNGLNTALPHPREGGNKLRQLSLVHSVPIAISRYSRWQVS